MTTMFSGLFEGVKRAAGTTAVVFAILLPAFLLPAKPAAAAPAHLFQPNQCGECHLRPSREGTFIRPDAFRTGITELCTSCHDGESSGVGHRVGMVPSMRVPDDFRLDAAGRMTCATCHDTHATDGRTPHLLRRPPGAALCTACHRKDLPLRAPTLLAVTFPPDGSVVAGRDTVVAGTAAGAGVEKVRVRYAGTSIAVPVVGGTFSAALRLPKGRTTVMLEAGSSTVSLTLVSRTIKAGWTPHLTRDTTQCATCHQDWERAGFSRSGPAGEGCYRCHERLDRLPYTHRPAALGECSACHDPHGITPVKASFAAGGACGSCHDGKAAVRHLRAVNAGKFSPVASCAGCHDAHQSTRAALTTSAPESLALALDLEAPEPRIRFGPGGELALNIDGFGFTDDSGRPRLPEKIVSLAVPPGANARSARLKVIRAETVELPGVFTVPPAPPAAAYVEGRELRDWGRGRTVREGRDEKVYGADLLWPAAPATLERSAGFRGVDIVRVAFHPLQYNPVRGTMTLTRRIVAEIEFSPRPEGRLAVLARKAFGRAGADLGKLGLTNGRQAISWSAGEEALPATDDPLAAPKAFEGVTAASGEPGESDYVIVTTRAIAAASTGLESFVNHKAARGFTVHVATEDDYGEVPAGTGRAVAIRQWLQAVYEPLGVRYVLLVGNPHPETGDIPMLRAWPRRGAISYTDYLDAPTDLFYADLSGDWDLDSDGYLGEFRDDSGEGGVDFVPEVYVGRIPVYGSDVVPLDAVLAKIAAYENDDGDISWRRSVLLPMSFSDNSTDGAWLAEQMKTEYLVGRGFSPWTLYQQGGGGGGTSVFTPDTELRGGAAEARWSAVPYGVVAWWGHGSATRTLVGYSGAWDGDLIAAPAATLNDVAPAFVYQTACLNAFPESGSNLAFSLLRRGAIATVGASRVSWYYVGQHDFRLTASNAGIGYQYISRLTAGEPAGKALLLAKGDPALPTASETTWMNLMDFNLYGDPSVGLFRGPQLQLSTPALSFVAAEGETAPITTAFSATSGDETLPVEILPEATWLAGAPLAGQTPADFTVTAHPAGLAPGIHTAQVLVTSAGAGNSPLSIPVTLEITSAGGVGGRVLAADGTALAGVIVTLLGTRNLQTVTDAAGGYGFAPLPPGPYSFSVSGTTYPFAQPPPAVNLGAGEYREYDLTAIGLAIRGRVRTRTRRPVAKAVVRLYDASGVLLRQVRTNRQGRYAFNNLAPGDYVVKARRRPHRFTPKQRAVTLGELSITNTHFRGR